MIRDPEWMGDAACRDYPPDTMFPRPGDRAASDAALRICHSCPVEQPCLNAAMEGHLEGIWGGTTDRMRRSLRSPKKKPDSRDEEPMYTLHFEDGTCHTSQVFSNRDTALDAFKRGARKGGFTVTVLTHPKREAVAFAIGTRGGATQLDELPEWFTGNSIDVTPDVDVASVVDAASMMDTFVEPKPATTDTVVDEGTTVDMTAAQKLRYADHRVLSMAVDSGGLWNMTAAGRKAARSALSRVRREARK